MPGIVDPNTLPDSAFTSQGKSICVIPARAGSQRIKDKNIRPFLGQPVIKYTLDAVAGLFDEVIVTTDSDEIGSVAAANGAIYHKRPRGLAERDVPMFDAIAEVCDKHQPDTVCMAYACAPFINRDMVTIGLETSVTHPGDVVLAAYQSREQPERALLQATSGELLSRYPEYADVNLDQFEPTYYSAGMFYIAKWKQLRRFKTWTPSGRMRMVDIHQWAAIDIDTEDDWKHAEMMAKVAEDKGLFAGIDDAATSVTFHRNFTTEDWRLFALEFGEQW